MVIWLGGLLFFWLLTLMKRRASRLFFFLGVPTTRSLESEDEDGFEPEADEEVFVVGFKEGNGALRTTEFDPFLDGRVKA